MSILKAQTLSLLPERMQLSKFSAAHPSIYQAQKVTAKLPAHSAQQEAALLPAEQA